MKLILVPFYQFFSHRICNVEHMTDICVSIYCLSRYSKAGAAFSWLLDKLIQGFAPCRTEMHKPGMLIFAPSSFGYHGWLG